MAPYITKNFAVLTVFFLVANEMKPRACIFRGCALICKTLTSFLVFKRGICKQDSGRWCPPQWAPEKSQVSAPSSPTLSLCPRFAIRSAGSGDAGFVRFTARHARFSCHPWWHLPGCDRAGPSICQNLWEQRTKHLSADSFYRELWLLSQAHTHTRVHTLTHTHRVFFSREFLLLLWLSTNCSFEISVFGWKHNKVAIIAYGIAYRNLHVIGHLCKPSSCFVPTGLQLLTVLEAIIIKFNCRHKM